MNAHISPSFSRYSKPKESLAVCTESLRSGSGRDSSMAIQTHWSLLKKHR